ncbi:MAG: hypothetical protein U5N58_09780 [Actinomycetota bacterium]|nr:hypothetical protein [Actinomycetota bacterium]
MAIEFRKVKLGFVNLALDFLEGEDLETAAGYAEDAKKMLENMGAEISEYPKPMSSRPLATEAWKQFKADNVDGVVIFNGTFSTGDITVELVRNTDCPFLIWGIEEFAISKHNFTGSMVGVMPAGTIFKNFGRTFSFAYGNAKSGKPKKNVEKFIKAVTAIAYLKEAVIGVIGMRPDGFEIFRF